MTSIIFTAKAGEKTLPAFNTQGGPFSGKKFNSQKIIADHTVYLTYRAVNGTNLEQKSSVALSFKLRYTKYLFSLFQKGQHSYLKCAYISSHIYDFDDFYTGKCNT